MSNRNSNSETTRLVPNSSRNFRKSFEDQKEDNYISDFHSNDIDGTSCANSSCSGSIKSLVFGGIDGIISSLVIMSGAAGSKLSWQLVVVLGIANTIANAFFTGTSEFLSFKAHREFILAAKRREMWEFKHYKDIEILEMVNRFESRGMARRDAEIVVSKMALYENFFVGLMVAEELGLQPPEDDDAMLLTDAFVMFLSFAIFGTIPVIIYGIGGYFYLSSEINLFIIADIASLAILFGLGIMKSTFSSSHWLYCSFESLMLGILVSLVSYFVGSQLMIMI